MYDIPLNIPCIGAEEKAEVIMALESNMLTNGFHLDQMTEMLFEKIRNPVVLCSSGTSALHLALHVLGIGRGDEVIIPNISFAATANAVLYTGATPVLCDIGDPSYELSIRPEDVKRLINEKTKAIIITHLFGGFGNIEEIVSIAKNKGLYLIEDAAQALGCFFNGKSLGTFGDVGIFSFNGNKIITTAGGGALTSCNFKIIERVRSLINQAKVDSFYHSEMGFNYRLSNVQAAIGVAQLRKLEAFIGKKRHIHDAYSRRLRMLQYHPISNYWTSVCTEFSSGLYDYLSRIGIETRPIYTPFNRIDYLSQYSNSREFPKSDEVYARYICLPSSVNLTDDDIEKVINAVSSVDSSS